MESKTQKIRSMYFTDPKVDPKLVAKEVGCDLSYAYVVRNKLFPELRRKKGKKAKVKNKTIKFLPIKVKPPVEAVAKVDVVNSPPHYTKGGIETYDFIVAKKLSYELGNVVKYVSRAEHKGNKLQDLQKALWYLNAAIDREEVKP